MKSYPFSEPPFEPQFGEQFERAGAWLRRALPRIAPIAVAVIGLLWLASGIYIVGPGQVGVVRTFGKESARTEPGLNHRFPWPFQQVDVVSVELIRRIEVGFRGGQRVHEQALMLTGDENIVEAQIVVQYRVADPAKFLFRLREPEATLSAATEVALRSTAGSMTIDQVMIGERARVQDEAWVFIQRLMDAYESGLTITDVKLQAADPPDAVRDAFHDVVRAREDKERLINQAHGYQADLLPKARGEAQKILREAEGYEEKRVLLAQGEAARFLDVLAEYEKLKGVTRDRLHLETMAKILPDSDKMILDGGLVRSKRADLPREVQQSVFAWMQAEREREAERYRSEGEEEANKLRAQTDKERTIILAEAEQNAQKLRGAGDAEATRIYAEAYGKNPEFHRFVRSLQSYELFLGKRTTLLLSADSPLFRYLTGPQLEAEPPLSGRPSVSRAGADMASE